MKESLDKEIHEIKKPGTEPNRTEVSRIAMFEGSDQNEWARLSKEVELKLSEMFSTNENISALCNYAKDQRNEIAKQLKQVGKFGVPRKNKSFVDKYNDNYFAGGAPNRVALIRMKEILIQNGAIDDGGKLLDDDEFKLRSQHKSSTIVREIPLHTYITSKTSSQEVTNELYTQGDGEDEKITILCRWPLILKWKYDATLCEREPIRQQLLSKNCQGEEVLLLLGLLAYDLSNIILYKRGSAAITGWIIRAIAKEKGFNLDGALQVNGLPFDVCAQVHSRESYALDFADSIIKEFNLDVAQNSAMRANLDKKVNNNKLLPFNRVVASCLKDFKDPSKSNREKMDLLNKIRSQLRINSDDHLVELVIKCKHPSLLNLLLESADFLTQKQVDTLKCCQNLLEIAEKIKPDAREAEKRHFLIDYEMTEHGTLHMRIEGATYSKNGYIQHHGLDTQRNKVKQFIYETFGWADFNFDYYSDRKNLTIPFEEILIPKSVKPYEESPLKLLSIFEPKASSRDSLSSSGEKTLESRKEEDLKEKEQEESENQQTPSASSN